MAARASSVVPSSATVATWQKSAGFSRENFRPLEALPSSPLISSGQLRGSARPSGSVMTSLSRGCLRSNHRPGANNCQVRYKVPMADVVKQQVAAHWNRRAAGFDEDFGHSIRTPAERAAWDRILDLVLPGGRALEALDVGCGTGFLSFELAARAHRVTGVDFAPAMIAEARRKAVARAAAIRFEEGDAEQLRFASSSFDLVISRHVLWTLAHPE